MAEKRNPKERHKMQPGSSYGQHIVGRINKLKRPSEFSKPQLALFVIVFALIGFLIYRSFAAGNLVASLEAEQMSLPAGASAVTDSAASGGKALKLAANGTTIGSVSFPSSVTSLTVMARGTQCQGAPAMTVTFDGTNVLSNTAVSATTWTAYSYTPTNTISSGSHSLSISFTNDNSYSTRHGHKTTTCSRDLYLDVTNFYGPTPAPTPAPTVTLSASPSSVTAGASSTLTWASTNADSCTASGAWSGIQATSGSASTGALNQTSTYTLTCTGAGGSASAVTSVGINSTSGFTTSLTQGMTITPPYTWKFNPGVSTVKAYFWADGVLLNSSTTPASDGSYTFTIQTGTLTAGAHTLGHAWDLADGTHQMGPTGYNVTVAGSTPGTSGGPGTGYSGPWRDTSYSLPSTFTKVITSASAFKTLISASGSLVAGDVVHVVGPMTLDGYAGGHTSFNKFLSSPASIYIDDNVVFAGDTNTGVGYNAVYVDGANLNIYGGTIAGGMGNGGLKVGPGFSTDTQTVKNIKWWGLKVHDVGGGGVYVGGGKNGAGTFVGTDYIDIDSETWNLGLNYNVDPHAVKGTGIHAIYIGGTDDPPVGISVNHSKFSVYSHDSSRCPGDAQVGPATQNTEFWVRVNNLSFYDATGGGWTAARAFTPWTAATNSYTDANITVHDVEAHNVTGPVVFTESLGSGPVTVEYGRGVNVLTSSAAYSYFGGKAYQPNTHVTYQNVL